MNSCNYTDYLKQVYETMSVHGIFLTVKSRDGSINTMTLGWGSIGWQWIRPTATVLVRESRYTHTLLDNADSFTLSIPKDDTLNAALKYCGTHSGRDGDKFGICHLTPVNGQKVDCPIVGEAWLHYECKIVGRRLVRKEDYLPEFGQKIYADNDMHEFFFGEIVACYTL